MISPLFPPVLIPMGGSVGTLWAYREWLKVALAYEHERATLGYLFIAGVAVNVLRVFTCFVARIEQEGRRYTKHPLRGT